MKRRDLLSAFWDVLLTWALAFAGAGCLATALRLPTNLSAVALTALAAAVWAGLGVRLRRGWIFWLATFLLGARALWHLDVLEAFYPQLKQALTYYDNAYGWGVPWWLEAYESTDATLAICVIAAGCGLLGGISLGKNNYPGTLLSLLLPVSPCVLVTDTVPQTVYIWLGIVAIGVVSISWRIRCADTRQANRLTALVLIPVMLASIVLFVRNPRETYKEPDRNEGVFLWMEKLADRLPFMNRTPGGNGGNDGSGGTLPMPESEDWVDLSAAGPRDTGGGPAMVVVDSRSGVLYLRSRGYGDYGGDHWLAMPGQELLDLPDATYLSSGYATVQVQTPQVFTMRLIPYYPIAQFFPVAPEAVLEDGMVKNNGLTDYSYRYVSLRADWKLEWNRRNKALTLSVLQNQLSPQLVDYLQLPQSTAQQAAGHLQALGLDDTSNVLAVIKAITQYVQDIAPYNLNTEKMPQGEQDFALWFLEESESGYCVHYASAAVVLLRAAGIPTRYVEGYLLETRADEAVTVWPHNAHAWAECYLPGIGWVVVEATPASGLPVILPTEPTEPTEPSMPTVPTSPVITVPTAPTAPAPTKPTAPSAPTKPTGPSAPTKPTAPTQPSTTQPVQTQPPVGDTHRWTSRDWSGLLRVLGAIGGALVAVLLAILQWRLRLWLRQRKMSGCTWEQVRFRWRYACLLAKLCGRLPPAALRALAEKAKFSQHTLTQQELRRFDRYAAACVRGLGKRPWPVRLVLRLVLAAW